ncbi:tRNA modification GTPase MnmE [Phycisphaerales bacterium]|nr:tRNA modification GTPase MnmE [Phycisphaerales bacterium]
MSLAATIAACSTAPGRSARAMIRVSGPTVPSLAATLTGSPTRRGCTRGALPLPGENAAGSLPLPVLLAFFHAPHSYTGEDVLELQLPGNPALIDRVLRYLASFPGVRPAQPGEFTARAYFAGRLTLDQAEGVAAAIAAATNEQLAAARELLQGRAGAAYQGWADEASMLLALVEAGIDFTDQEDVRPIEPAALLARLGALRQAIASHLGARAGAEATVAQPLVVLVGRPNAGKSTLFNALLGRRRAVAGPIAGTTRDALVEPLDLSPSAPGAGTVQLADLAGLDDMQSDQPDALAQAAARHTIARADLLLWCDPTSRFDERDLPPTSAEVLRIRTFADRPADPHPRVPQSSFRVQHSALPVCALDGWHLADLKRAIAEHACSSNQAPLAALLPRHRAAMHDAIGAIDLAATLIDTRDTGLRRPEELAQTLRAALDALGELRGRISPDDILGKVFATFCVGK